MCHPVSILMIQVKLNRETNYIHENEDAYTRKLSTVAYVQLSADFND